MICEDKCGVILTFIFEDFIILNGSKIFGGFYYGAPIEDIEILSLRVCDKLRTFVEVVYNVYEFIIFVFDILGEFQSISTRPMQRVIMI
tara:strand:+ start:251 stop:517 length:267 start_codon:yes stop_codon:yes gene_type:complete